MNRGMEKITVLSLSFMLTTTFSVTPLLPLMQKAFPGYSTDQVEMLVSIPSFCIMLVVLFSSRIYRFFSERFWIITGLLLAAVAGVVPVFVQVYPVIFIARAIMGLGLGLVNGRAISMISERFDGKEKTTLLGYRASVEVAGNILMTLIVGRLLLIGWNVAFCIYGFALVILVLYLRFLPDEPGKVQQTSGKQQERLSDLSGVQKRKLLRFALAAGFMIVINSVLSLRIPSLVLEREMGNESDSSLILSGLMVASIAAGVAFGKMKEWWNTKLELLGFLGTGISLLVIVSARSLMMLTVGAILSGFFYMIPLTCSLNGVSEELPLSMVGATTAVVLVSCNLSASLSPVLLKLIALVNGRTETPYLLFAGIAFVAGILSGVRKKKNM